MAIGIFSGSILFIAFAAVAGAVLGGVFSGAPTQKAAIEDFKYQQTIEKQKDAIAKEHEMHLEEHVYHDQSAPESTTFRDNVRSSQAASAQTSGRG